MEGPGLELPRRVASRRVASRRVARAKLDASHYVSLAANVVPRKEPERSATTVRFQHRQPGRGLLTVTSPVDPWSKLCAFGMTLPRADFDRRTTPRRAPLAALLLTISVGAYACSEESLDPKRSLPVERGDASVLGNTETATDASATNTTDANGVDASSIDGASSRPSLESLRNFDPMFRKHETATRADLDALGFGHDDFTTPADRFDNGPSPTEGQFRIQCQWSHFGYDDPIVRPGSPGAAHLHMFWGNTNTNARSISRTPSTAVKKWTDGCFDPLNVGAGPRNCSNGQTGTDRRFPQMNATNAYEGPNFFLKLPE